MTVGQRLALATAASLLLHLAIAVGPGWRVPTLGDTLLPESSSSPQIEARLTGGQHRSAPAPAAAQPQASRRPPARRSAPKGPAAPPGVLAMPAPVEPVLAMSDMESFAPSLAAASASTAASSDAGNVQTAATAAPPRGTAPEPAASDDAASRIAALPVEVTLPRKGSIRFSVEKGFTVGESVHRWSLDGNEYSMTSVTQTTGLAALFQPVRLSWTSLGTLDASGLRPREFRVEKNGVAGDSAEFDWTAMQLTLSSGAQTDVPLVSGAQDMLSVFYQLGMHLPALVDRAATHKDKVPARAEIMVATGRKFERYGFDVVGEETLSLKIGRHRTVHLRTASGKEATEVWLAPGLRNLPLMIRITDRKGESYDQIAESIEFEGMPPDAGRR